MYFNYNNKRVRMATEKMKVYIFIEDSSGSYTPEGELRNHQKQQRTGQAPEGFTDALAAGNSLRSRGVGREVAEPI